MKNKLILAAAGVAALAAAALAAAAQGRWDWTGGRPGTRDYPLAGAGARMLLPELRATLRGRAFVARNFDFNRDGLVQPREARAANLAFVDVAGPNRARFDWNRFDRGFVVDRGPVRAGGWDRRAMHDYGFRQTPRGATLTLEEQVLFDTDSSALRPGAARKLVALSDYLRANPGVRVAIDGHTDSRASDGYNLALSERRADAVRGAFDELGVTRARFAVAGHGERQPVASNATAQGMQRNRRVEITLLGRRATEFARY